MGLQRKEDFYEKMFLAGLLVFCSVRVGAVDVSSIDYNHKLPGNLRVVPHDCYEFEIRMPGKIVEFTFRINIL